METHVKVIGVIYIVLGIIGVLCALAMMVLFGGIAGVIGTSAGQEPDARIAIPILGAVGGFLVLLILILSLPGILAGWGLLQFKEWARILGIVLSVLNLFAIPVGTLIGIYGLWVLLNRETLPLFQRPPAAG